MNQWRIHLSNEVDKFFKRNKVTFEEVADMVGKAVSMFRGEVANVDIKKLKGKWVGYYRIRKGRIRMIVSFDFEIQEVHIAEVDWRGNVYK